MATASIVRIGPTTGGGNLSSDLLKEAIVSYFRTTRNSNDDGDSNNGDDKHKIVVRNKYFSANIIFDDIEGLSSSTGAGATTTAATTTTKEDGCILVFDGMKSNPDHVGSGLGAGDGTTFDQLAIVQDKADNNNNTNSQRQQLGDLLRLCVGITLKPDSSPEEWRGTKYEAEYSRRILWCLDHGYEYVEADLTAEGQRRGHDERDKEGFARIIEAIEGTVWSSAVMGQQHTQQTKQLKQSYDESKAALTGSSSSAAVGEGDAKMEQANQKSVKDKEGISNGNTYVPPATDLSSSTAQPLSLEVGVESDNADKEAEERTKQLLDGGDGDGSGNKDRKAALTLDPALGETTSNGASKPGDDDDDNDDDDAKIEKHFDQMDGLVQEAKRIREASQNGTMTDDERRERAGDAALALLNLMGDLGMDDGSDDDSGGSDHE